MTVVGRQQAYSAGNKTYGFGRSNPTSGPVDPLGYRERNLMQNAAIGRRLSSSSQPSQPFYQVNSNGPQNVGIQSLQSAGFNYSPSPTGTMQAAPAPTPAPLTDANGPQNQLGGLSTPAPMASDSGGIGPAVDSRGGGGGGVAAGGAVSSALPGPHFNSSFSPGGVNNPRQPSGYMNPAGPPGMQSGGIPSTSQAPASLPPPPTPPAYNQQDMPGYANAQHQINSGAYEQERNINDAAPAAYQHLTDVYAGRGLVHSGRYATDYGAAQNQTAGQLAGLEQQKAQQLEALDQQNVGWNQQQADAQQQKFQQQLQSQIGQAGDLGLSNVPQPAAPDYGNLLTQLLGGGYGQTPAGVNPSPGATLGLGNPAPLTPSNSVAPATGAQYTAADYSPGQLSLMIRNGIPLGSLSPAEVHQLGVSTGYRPGAPGGVAIAPGFTPAAAPTATLPGGSRNSGGVRPAKAPVRSTVRTPTPANRVQARVPARAPFRPVKATAPSPGPQAGAKAPRIPSGGRGKR